MFEAPERAVRCAESIIAAVGSLGLQVRAGVHTGECEVIGGGVGGMAVHIGARVAALAGPGEVLVTGSVRDLMTGSDRHFDGGEPRQLKGVADPWPIYRLVPDEANGEALASHRPSMVPLYTRRQKRHLVVAMAAGLVVVLAVSTVRIHPDALRPRSSRRGERGGACFCYGRLSRVTSMRSLSGNDPGGCRGWRWSRLGHELQPKTPCPASTPTPSRRASTIPVGSAPSGVAVGAGAVWVANSGDGTVSKIDPRDNSRQS